MGSTTAVIAIFDIGKTNKKLFLLDEQYRIVWECSTQLKETVDEDGEACENLFLLTQWVAQQLRVALSLPQYHIRAINFSAYGASFVYLDANGAVLTPLYNYLKAYPQPLQQAFYSRYGGEQAMAQATASPVLGSLNSGMQLYRLKQERPDVFRRIATALHLPQYLRFLVTGQCCTEITSIGCHTQLWNFEQHAYHRWVKEEGLLSKMPPLFPSDQVIPYQLEGQQLLAGAGLHDSSAALIPYLTSFNDPFVLLSTGTWCISLNPFNNHPLTAEELQQDCLCYCGYQGKAVKASRLFAGNEHEQQTRRLALYFHLPADFYKSLSFNPDIIASLQQLPVAASAAPANGLQQSIFASRDLSLFRSAEQAYHCLISDIVTQQQAATQLVIQDTPVKRIFVDGGFGKNPVFMHLLAAAFPLMEVFAASVAQATAVGAALAIHPHWNNKPLPGDLVELKYYSVTQN